MSRIKELRKEKGLTQIEAAALTNIPLRTFKCYENDPTKEGNIKYKYIVQALSAYGHIDEEHGILGVEEIAEKCKNVFSNYKVEYAILFGSYATGRATEKSDVDVLIATDEKGLAFYGIVEELRASLKKKVDLLDLAQLTNNQELINEILRDGVKIYG